MSKLNISVVELKEDKPICGLWLSSNDRSQSKDIPSLSKKYYEIVNKNSGEVIPFFVLSQSYNKSTKDFELFVGGLLENNNLDTMVIPKGLYGKASIKPKMGFIWRLAIGETKKYFYTKWLPKSDYLALNMEYEYHTEISKGKNPQIDIFFAIKRRTN